MYKVMIVDDEPIIVEGLSRSIAWNKWNCKVVATAHDGLEGKKSIEEYRPDIIFMDINMPEMDGLLIDDRRYQVAVSEFTDMCSHGISRF